jgi:hypothetical protein
MYLGMVMGSFLVVMMIFRAIVAMANYSTIRQGMLMFVNAGCGLNGKMGENGFGFFGTTTSYTHITSIKTETGKVYRLSYSNLTLSNQAQNLGHRGDRNCPKASCNDLSFGCPTYDRGKDCGFTPSKTRSGG